MTFSGSTLGLPPLTYGVGRRRGCGVQDELTATRLTAPITPPSETSVPPREPRPPIRSREGESPGVKRVPRGWVGVTLRKGRRLPRLDGKGSSKFLGRQKSKEVVDWSEVHSLVLVSSFVWYVQRV